MLRAKIIFACCAAVIFLALGVLDLFHHEPKVGIASLCLGVANGLLLLPWSRNREERGVREGSLFWGTEAAGRAARLPQDEGEEGT